MKNEFNEYNIKIRTKEGTYEYEKVDLDNLDLIVKKHSEYEELRATQNKPKMLIKKLGGQNGRNTKNR